MQMVADRLVEPMLMKFMLYLQFKCLIQASISYDLTNILRILNLHIHGPYANILC